MSMTFLMCSERSGSNLIVKLLNGHSAICGPSTKHIINPVARNLFRYEDIWREENWMSLLQDIHNLMSVEFSVWKRSFSLDDLRKLAPCGDIAELIRNIFIEEARANGKKHVFIKENQVYEFQPFLLINFPDAKYIYQVRDPRDMALSWKKNPEHEGGVVNAARQWKKDQQNSLKNYNELRKAGKAIFVKYEDLIGDTEGVVSRICDFLGLEYEEGILEYYKDETTRKNASMQKAWSNLDKGVLKENKRKFVSELSREEIMAVEKICYSEMLHLGYAPEFSLPELDAFSDDRLGVLGQQEARDFPVRRSVGVSRNMAAKKRFYQRVPLAGMKT
ncbi:MAG: sulfotransferase [Nitrosomonadales bacterium]|nr:sulfotransferase [Nitrosomonadales bacterium]